MATTLEQQSLQQFRNGNNLQITTLFATKFWLATMYSKKATISSKMATTPFKKATTSPKNPTNKNTSINRD